MARPREANAAPARIANRTLEPGAIAEIQRYGITADGGIPARSGVRWIGSWGVRVSSPVASAPVSSRN